MMRRSWSRAIALGLVFVGAACGASPVEEMETEAAVPVSVERARVQTLSRSLTVTGVVAPAPGADWTIAAPAPARVVDLPRAEGDAVRTGDLLVRFDIPSFTAELAARRADVDQAGTRLATARAAVDRLQGLFDKGIAAAREVDDARREQADAAAALSQAETGVEAARAMLSRTEVRATSPGVVAQRWHSPGDLVDGSADPVLRVIDPTRLQVLAAVPLSDLRQVAVGQSATVVTGDGAGSMGATVVATPGHVVPGRSTADVRLALSSPTSLPVGATLPVELALDVHDEALTIPASAVLREGGDVYVMVAGEDGRAHKRVVTVGLETVDRVEIATGLSNGDRAIVRGQDALPDGADVTIEP